MSLDASTSARLIAAYPAIASRISEVVEVAHMISSEKKRVLENGALVDKPTGYSRTRKFLLPRHGTLALVDEQHTYCRTCLREIV